MTERKVQFWGKNNLACIKIYCLLIKAKATALFKIGTCISVDYSSTHCATETDTHVWGYKVLQYGLKSRCYHLLS